MLIGEKDFETAFDNLVSCSKLELRGNDSNKMYFITTHRDYTIFDENSIQLSNETLTSPQTITRSPAMMKIKE